MNKKSHTVLFLSILAIGLLCLANTADAKNLHLLESNDNGFAAYRSGQPSKDDIIQWCKLGITEVVSLSGSAKNYEKWRKQFCPKMKIVYNTRQFVGKPLDSGFLEFFDSWIEKAKKDGTKVLFHCQCGCHRAGRLAAYYEIKYLGLSFEEAKENLLRYGKTMWRYPMLEPQILALKDYHEGVPCRFSNNKKKQNKYCVRPSMAKPSTEASGQEEK